MQTDRRPGPIVRGGLTPEMHISKNHQGMVGSALRGAKMAFCRARNLVHHRPAPQRRREVAVSLALKVARIEAVTPRIKSVELVAAAGGALPGFTAGGAIAVTPGHSGARASFPPE